MPSMAGYTKLFNSILASTIWRAPDKTRIVWITLLAMADKNGVAEGSVPGLADFARVSIPACRKALAELMAPDDDSRSQEYEGRRIEATDGGWRILNHGKYRERLNTDERREYFRLKKREQRRRSTTVQLVKDKSTPSTQAEAEAEATTEAREEHDPRADALDAGFLDFWESYPKKAGKKDALKAWLKLKPSANLQAQMLGVLAEQCRSRQWREDHGKFVPLPATWLRGERWTDELDPQRDFLRAKL